MKRIIPIILLTATAFTANAQQQIGNAGMEDWQTITGSSVEPTNWNSFLTAGGSVNWAASDQVQKSTDMHSGSFSCRINAKSTLGVIANGNLTLGKINMGSASPTNSSNYNSTIQNNVDFSEAFTGHPDSLVFWVKFVPASNNNTDSARIAAFIHDDFAFQDGAGGSPYAASVPHMVAKGIKNFSKTNNAWMRMSVPFTYTGNSISTNYMLITFTTNKTPGGGSDNDYLYIDDVQLIYSTAPVAQPDNAMALEATPVDINVVANDSDADGTMNNASVTVTTNPAHGTVSVNTGNGHITYTSDAGFHGTDSFIYSISNNDATPASDTAIVHVLVNGKIVANDDAVTTPQDTPTDIAVANNDVDPESDVDLSSVTIITATTHGTTTISGGVVHYTPAAGYFGTDMFTYSISDNGTPMSTDTATVNINISQIIVGQNNQVIANNDAATTSENNAVTIDVLSNDVDPEDQIDESSLAIVANPAHGSVSINGSHQIVYTPTTGYSGADSFTYKICDLGTPATCDTGMVSITITSNLGLNETTISGIYFTIADGKLLVFNADNMQGTVKVYANSGQLVLNNALQSSYNFDFQKGIYFVVFEGSDMLLNQKVANY